MANENSIDVYHALMALEEKVTGVAPDPENVTTDVALALADIFRTDAPMAQETAIVNAIDTITANYSGGGGGVDVGAPVTVLVDVEEPTVGGGGMGGADGPHTVAIGDTVIGNGDIPGLDVGTLFGSFAAGMTAQTMSYEGDTLSAYACTIGDDGEGNTVFLTVAPYALEATRTSGEGGYSWTFVIPEMNEGVSLVLYPHTAG